MSHKRREGIIRRFMAAHELAYAQRTFKVSLFLLRGVEVGFIAEGLLVLLKEARPAFPWELSTSWASRSSENSLSSSTRNDSWTGSSEGSAPLARTRGVRALSTW